MRFTILVLIFLATVKVFGQQGEIVRSDGTKINFHHLVGIMEKDTTYSPKIDLKNYFRLDYKGKMVDLFFDKIKSISFFQKDTTFIYRIETKTGISQDYQLNFVGIEYISDDPFNAEMMRVCLPIVTFSSGARILNIKAINFIY